MQSLKMNVMPPLVELVKEVCYCVGEKGHLGLRGQMEDEGSFEFVDRKRAEGAIDGRAQAGLRVAQRWSRWITSKDFV